MGFESEQCQIFWIFTNLRTKVLNMKKTSVLVLLSGLFDWSRSRTVTALHLQREEAEHSKSDTHLSRLSTCTEFIS